MSELRLRMGVFGKAFAELRHSKYFLHTVFTDSPGSVYVLDQIRRDMLRRCSAMRAPRFPCDCFVYSRGRSESRSSTCIGGLPYRPKDLAWPKDDSGEYMAFVAQFNFKKSADIIRDLPGDIMLVFSRVARTISGNVQLQPTGRDGMHFEWHNLGNNDVDLADASPDSRVVIPELMGVRHRTFDIEVTPQALACAYESVPDFHRPSDPTSHINFYRACCIMPRMKVGGLPYWYNKEPTSVPGRFICSFSGVAIAVETPFPWTNVQTPLTPREGIADNVMLAFGTIECCLNYYIKQDGTVSWTYEYK